MKRTTMNYKNIGFGLAAAATLSAGTVLAASPAKALTFDFSTLPDFTQSVFQTTQNDLTLTIDADPNNRKVVKRDNVLGIMGAGLGVKGSFLDDPQLDGLGFGPDDKLNFTFSEPVTLKSTKFSRVGRLETKDIIFNDSFRLFVDGVEKIADQDIPGGTKKDDGYGEVQIALTGTKFSFTVPSTQENLNGKFEDYFIESIHVTPVPTPALLPGILGMFAAMRKKRKGEIA